MERESLNEPNPSDQCELIEAGPPKPENANGREEDTLPAAQGKALRVSAKRRAEGAALETEVPPLTQSYLIPAYSMNGDRRGNPDESFGSDVRAALGLLREKIWLIILCVLVAGIGGASFIILCPPTYRAQALIPVEKKSHKKF